MIRLRPDASRGRFLVCLLLLLAVLPAAARTSLDLPPLEHDREAWLITISPGDLYWQRFGHNAIWLREPARGLDHTFNFGYFDFRQEDFFLRFVQGRMLYQSLAFSAAEELPVYAQENRSILAQRLELSDAEYARLRDHLLWHVQPANRDYLYDYYLDNCSTRVRDAIDLAVDGALSDWARAEPARAGFREHTRRLTQMTWWYYLGLESVLGRPVDRPISRWEEMFIPGVLAQALATPGAGKDGVPLVRDEHWIYRADRAEESATATPVWWRYLCGALASVFAVWLVTRPWPRWRPRLARSWLGLASALGVLLLLLWAFTDHRVAGPNANLLLFNPLFALALGRRSARILNGLVWSCGLLALAQWLIFGWQYDLDVVAFVLPLNAFAAGVLLQDFRVSRALP